MDGHGEYKMPGGKLVVADLSVVAGRLARVAVSGDFFLEPDTALAAIDQALLGLDASAGADVLAGAVTAVLPADTRMFGVDASAIAIAVRRAVDAARPA